MEEQAGEIIMHMTDKSPLLNVIMHDSNDELNDEASDQDLETTSGLLRVIRERREKAFGKDEIKRATDLVRTPFEEMKLFVDTASPEQEDGVVDLCFSVGYELGNPLDARDAGYILQTYLSRAGIIDPTLSQNERIVARTLISSAMIVGLASEKRSIKN